MSREANTGWQSQVNVQALAANQSGWTKETQTLIHICLMGRKDIHTGTV